MRKMSTIPSSERQCLNPCMWELRFRGETRNQSRDSCPHLCCVTCGHRVAGNTFCSSRAGQREQLEQERWERIQEKPGPPKGPWVLRVSQWSPSRGKAPPWKRKHKGNIIFVYFQNKIFTTCSGRDGYRDRSKVEGSARHHRYVMMDK